MISKRPFLIANKQSRQRIFYIIKTFRNYHVLSNLRHFQNPEEICKAFEKLGPTFIKIGQFFATRPDLVPSNFIKAFSQLQDNTPPDSFNKVKKIIENETKRKINDVYKSFDKQPFASASMGQVHHAVLKNGQSVVVKVQHPGIEKKVKSDLSLFGEMVKWFRFIPGSNVLDLQDSLQQIKQALLTELNTQEEISNGERFYQLNDHSSIIRVPKIYKKYSASRVLVNQSMPGKSIRSFLTQIQGKEEQPDFIKIKRKYIARLLIKNFFKQVFQDGFFHGDLHPGNILLTNVSEFKKQDKSRSRKKILKRRMPSYRLVFLDFGIMGKISSDLSNKLANILIAIAAQDTRSVEQEMLSISSYSEKTDQELFFSELDDFLSKYYQASFGQTDFPKMIYQMIAICRRNNVEIPGQVTLLFKGLSTLEGIVQILDPKLSMLSVAQFFTRQYLIENREWKNSFVNQALSLFQAIKKFPRVPLELINQLEMFTSGHGSINFNLRYHDKILDRIEKIIVRLTVGIILGALIISSSILLQSSQTNSFIRKVGTICYILSIMIIIIIFISDIFHYFKSWRRKYK